MDIDVNPSETNVNLIAGKPWPWLIGFLAVLLSIFITRSFFSDNSRQTDCQAQVIAANRRADRADSLKQLSDDKMVRLLLNQREVRERDSTAINDVLRKELGTKAKKVIINSKR